MTQVLVDLDPDELSQAKEILGTTKNTEVVRIALREVIAAKARRDVVAMFADGAFADLGDPEIRSAAWS